MKCSNCKTDITAEAIFCPQCGTRIVRESHIAEPVQIKFEHDISEFWPEWSIKEKLMSDVGMDVYKAVKKIDGNEQFATVKVITVSPEVMDMHEDFTEKSDADEKINHYQNIVNCIINEIYLTEAFRNVRNIVNVDEFKILEKTSEMKWEIYIRMDSVMPFNLYVCDKMLSEQDIIKLGCDICSALEACEKRKFVHSDIKLENIFVDENGTFFLDGFRVEDKLGGLSGPLQRTVHNFSAPEILKSIKYTSKVDTYSLGVIMYTLMNRNRIPFLSPTKQLLTFSEKRNALKRRMAGEVIPPPPEASDKLAKIILRACKYNPDDRFATATEMKDALIAISKNPYPPIIENESKELMESEEIVKATNDKETPKRGIKRFLSSKN